MVVQALLDFLKMLNYWAVSEAMKNTNHQEFYLGREDMVRQHLFY